jgi:hypothetical protein
MKAKIFVPILAFGIVVFFWLIARWPCAGVDGGMSMSQVQNIAGLPQRVRTNETGVVQWMYSQWLPPVRTSVFFNTNGNVSRIYTP